MEIENKAQVMGIFEAVIEITIEANISGSPDHKLEYKFIGARRKLRE